MLEEKSEIKIKKENVTRKEHHRVEVLLKNEIYDKLLAEARKKDYTITSIIKHLIEDYLSE